MSINYHAFQNKGFLLSGFEVICNQWRTDFTGFDPARAAQILKLDYDENFVYAVYYGRTFRLRLRDGVLERKLEDSELSAMNTSGYGVQSALNTSGYGTQSTLNAPVYGVQSTMNAPGHRAQSSAAAPGRTSASSTSRRTNSYLGTDSIFNDNKALDLETSARFTDSAEPGWTEDVYFNEAMALYHYLKDVHDLPGFAGVWIPNYTLDPRAVRKKDYLGASFAKNVAGRTELLERVCRDNGGREVPTKADLGFEFDAFKQVPVQIHYYEEDDDFPAQVQMLVDRKVTDYLNLECTGCLFADLFEMLERAMKQEATA